MTLEGLSSACAKLELAISKNNEILEINVLQKFTSHNKQCYMTLEGLSSACAELELAISKNNEILEINVLQKFTSHVTC